MTGGAYLVNSKRFAEARVYQPQPRLQLGEFFQQRGIAESAVVVSGAVYYCEYLRESCVHHKLTARFLVPPFAFYVRKQPGYPCKFVRVDTGEL